MTKQEIFEFLKDNLKIRICNDSYSGTEIRVELLLTDPKTDKLEVIDSDAVVL